MKIESEIARGRELHQQGKVDQAQAIYEMILAYQPQNDEVLSLMGLAALQTGRGPDAINFLNQAIGHNGKVAKYYSNLAIALLAEGDTDGAQAQVLKAIEIDDSFVDGHYNLGNIEAQRDQRDAAISAFRKVLELSADHVDAKANLAALLRIKGENREAVSLTREALTLRPNDPRLMFNLATALAMIGETDEANELLEKVAMVPEMKTRAEAFKAKMKSN